MHAQMGFVYAGVVTQVVMRCSRSVEAATTGSGIAVELAGNEGDNNNCGQRASATRPQTRVSWLTAAASVHTANIRDKPA
jgi:hypothetical protein